MSSPAPSTILPHTSTLLAGMLLGTSALAAPTSPRAHLIAALDEAGGAPEVAVSCAPGGTVLGLVAAVLGDTAGSDAGEEAALAAALGSAEGMAAVGLEPEGPVALRIWAGEAGPRGVMTLPFRGDPDQAAALLGPMKLGPSDGGSPAASWEAADGTQVALAEGELRMVFQGGPAEEGAAVDRALVEGLPDDAGCAFWAALPGEKVPGPEALRPSDALAMAGFVPFARGGSGVIRLRPAGPPPAVLREAPAAPVSGTSRVAPGLVLHMGVSAADLLGDATVQKALDLSPGVARKLSRKLNVGAGATVAAFGDPRARELVAVLPLVGGPDKPRRIVRRLARMARKADMDVVSKGERTMVMAAGGDLVFLEARPGRLTVGADAGLVREVAAGEGSPWVSSSDLAWLLQWPVAVWTPGGAGIGGPFEVTARAGLRAAPTDEVFELGVQVQTNAPPGMIAGLLSRVLATSVQGAQAAPAPAEDAPAEDPPAEDAPAPE